MRSKSLKMKKNLTPLQELEQVLEEEVKLYEDYARLLTEDLTLMSELKIEALEKNNKSKNTILLKIQMLDQVRQNCVRKVAEANTLQEEQIRLVDLCTVISKEEGERLLLLRKKLDEIMYNLKRLQEEAFVLAQTSLAWMRGSIASLQRLLTPHEIYNPQGQVDSTTLYAGRVVEKRI